MWGDNYQDASHPTDMIFFFEFFLRPGPTADNARIT